MRGYRYTFISAEEIVAKRGDGQEKYRESVIREAIRQGGENNTWDYQNKFPDRGKLHPG